MGKAKTIHPDYKIEAARVISERCETLGLCGIVNPLTLHVCNEPRDGHADNHNARKLNMHGDPIGVPYASWAMLSVVPSNPLLMAMSAGDTVKALDSIESCEIPQPHWLIEQAAKAKARLEASPYNNLQPGDLT